MLRPTHLCKHCREPESRGAHCISERACRPRYSWHFSSETRLKFPAAETAPAQLNKSGACSRMTQLLSTTLESMGLTGGLTIFWTELHLVLAGNGLWLDSNQRVCLILWHTADQWADRIYTWARSLGLEESVTTIDDLSSGDEVQGTGRVTVSKLCDRFQSM